MRAKSFIQLLLLLSFISPFAVGALSPDALKYREALTMKKLSQDFELANTKGQFVVDDFKSSEQNWLVFQRISAKAKIRSVESGQSYLLSYGVRLSNMPGPQQRISILVPGQTYELRINCKHSKCEPPYHQFFEIPETEYSDIASGVL